MRGTMTVLTVQCLFDLHGTRLEHTIRRLALAEGEYKPRIIP